MRGVECKAQCRPPDASLACQREAVDAFLVAARWGDFEALVAILDPDVVLHADRGTVASNKPRVARGARAVAEGALVFGRLAEFARPALVNGAAGVVVVGPHGNLFSVIGFTVANGKIVEIDILLDPCVFDTSTCPRSKIEVGQVCGRSGPFRTSVALAT